MKKKISIEYLHPVGLEEIFVRWNLDTPKDAKVVELENVIILKGWALLKENKRAILLIDNGDIIQSYEFDQIRQDVITKVLKVDVSGHPCMKCGFRQEISLENSLRIGFRTDTDDYWVANIVLKDINKISIGKKGYLFLEGDTNRSEDQFSGKLLISKEELDNWENYFSRINEMMSHAAAKWIFLLAPAKEYLFPEYHPREKANFTPLDQFFQRTKSWKSKIMYPFETLVPNKSATFSKTDSHWTDYGSLEVVNNILRYFDVKSDVEIPKFSLKFLAGDLGRQLNPPCLEPMFVADFSEMPAKLIFDNKIPNIGRIIHYENTFAQNPDVIMIFGGSSSRTLIPWLCLNYQNVVFVHSTGSVDRSVLEAIKPDKVILQTNSRFIVRTPVTVCNIESVIRQKIASGLVGDKQTWCAEQAAQSESILKCWHIERSLTNVSIERQEEV